MVHAFEILDICELIFFTPAIVLSGYVVYKHGHQKQLGWRFLVMICLFRLIGAIVSLVSVHHPSSGLTITYDIMNSFGLSAVVYTALGLLNRVESGMMPHGIPLRVFRLLGLPGLAGLILAIIGSTQMFSGNENDFKQGRTYLRAAICLFTSVYVADVLITMHVFWKRSYVQPGDRRLFTCVGLALPFIFVRILFSLLAVFANLPNLFSTWSLSWTPILVHGLMGVLMEAIVVSIFLFAGLTTLPAPKRQRSPPPEEEPKVGHTIAYDLGARSV